MSSSQIICCENLSAYYYPTLYSKCEADELYNILLQSIHWQEETYTIYGREVKAPRLMAWFGDNNAMYRYSGVNHQPSEWLPVLLVIKQKVESKFKCQFNSVLANLYRDGNDSMGWHADNEPELGKSPIIASVTFGEERFFSLRHNKNKQGLKLLLQHGSLLLMEGETQYYWKHALPKSQKAKQSRINLTFRSIMEE